MLRGHEPKPCRGSLTLPPISVPPEEIVAKLRQVEALMGQGKPVADAVRAIRGMEATYLGSPQRAGKRTK